MLYVFPAETFAVASRDYQRPYENPLSVRAGDVVRPVTDGSMTTDVIGWTWCIGSDGRAGWVPDGWCEATDGGWRLSTDYSAQELTVRTGDRLRVLYSESGFIACETADGERAWVPDAVLTLDHEDGMDSRQPSS